MAVKTTVFGLLGPLEVRRDEEPCTPTAPKVCRVLALLLLRSNHVVSTDALIEELWGEDPPRSAVTTTQTYIYQLRKALGEDDSAPSDDDMLLTRPPGYVLQVEDGQIDTETFQHLTVEGNALLEEGQPDQAIRSLDEGLGLWRGSALADISCGRLLEASAVHLEELRLRATELRVQANMELGRHRALIPELRSLVATYPLNEWMHAQLIQALNGSGRRADALRAYQDLRNVLSDELGLDPAPELQRLQQEMLSAGAGPTPLAVARPAV